MDELRMVLSAETSATRILAIRADASGSETLLKARLSAQPSHPRAMQWLIEALALWEGMTVRAALCAGEPGRLHVTRLYPDWVADFGNALYTLELIERRRARSVHRDAVRAMGEFRDLRQLSLEADGSR